MDDLSPQHAAIESLLENEALTAGLDDDAARALLDWGIANLQHMPQAAQGQAAEQIQEARETFQRSNRRLLRLINRWTASRREFGMLDNEDSLAQVFDLAHSLHPGDGVPPARQADDFLAASLTLPAAEFILALRAFAEGR